MATKSTANTATKKKSAASASPAASAPAPVAMRTIPTPPNVTFPPLPPASKQRKGKGASSKLAKPTNAQRTGAVDLAKELRGAKTFTADFGKIGVDPAVLADRLAAAAGWDAFFESADAWAPVARSIRTAAWDAVLRDLKPLGGFLQTVGAKSEVGQRYAAAVAFFEIRKEAAARGLATRATNKKAKEKAAKAGPAK